MLDPERSVEAVKQLKQAFGQEHHIHLYIHSVQTEWVEKLATAGLDELRFHLLDGTTKQYEEVIKLSSELESMLN